MLEFAITTAEKAGEALKKYFGQKLSMTTKSTQTDLVTQADLASERLILDAIKKTFPGHAILSEEEGKVGESDHIWIVDPLDGTTNFAHTYPHFSIAIALAYRGDIILSVTLDPLRNEIFTAEKGKGATLNGNPIQVSTHKSLSTSLVATGFPYNRNSTADNNLVEFSKIMPIVGGIRRSGSAALDLAYIASGRLDGYWELHLNPWDMAGGILLVTEAGGTATDITGGQWQFESKTAIAGNNYIYQSLFSEIQNSRHPLP